MLITEGVKPHQVSTGLHDMRSTALHAIYHYYDDSIELKTVIAVPPHVQAMRSLVNAVADAAGALSLRMVLDR